MIAAVTQATHSGSSWSLDNLPFNIFDLALVAVIAFGLFRGRRNGMTKEVLPTFQWITIVLVCGLGYEMIGELVVNISGWDKLLAYVLSYLFLALLVYLLFVPLKKALMPRLTGSNYFGGAEYYLGMVSGMIRYVCILLFFLALLNAPYYTAAEIQAHQAYAARWYGGGEKGFSGDYFPTLQQVQEDVFKKSLIGPFIKDYLGAVLINSVPSDADKQKLVPQKKPIIHIGN